jgi:hypothetical protein
MDIVGPMEMCVNMQRHATRLTVHRPELICPKGTPVTRGDVGLGRFRPYLMYTAVAWSYGQSVQFCITIKLSKSTLALVNHLP